MLFESCIYAKKHTLSSDPGKTTRECPKILKICQITKFDKITENEEKKIDKIKTTSFIV
jgi:hypothetical protein